MIVTEIHFRDNKGHRKLEIDEILSHGTAKQMIKSADFKPLDDRVMLVYRNEK